jgi:hypothetical protein
MVVKKPIHPSVKLWRSNTKQIKKPTNKFQQFKQKINKNKGKQHYLAMTFSFLNSIISISILITQKKD